MTIRQEDNGTYTVFHSARNPKTKRLYSLRRRGVKKLSEAKRVEKLLITKIVQKFNEDLTPRWEEVVKSFLDSSTEAGLAFKTIENRRLCLNAHTKDWMKRLVSEIFSFDIRNLISQKLSGRSPSQKKMFSNILGYVLSMHLKRTGCRKIQHQE